MEIRKLQKEDIEMVAPLVADFRVKLKSFKGLSFAPDVFAGKEELTEYLQAGYPSYVAMDQETCVGYIVCRIEEPTVWVESIFVREENRRKGIASMLFQKAEELAASFGEDTVFNYVHPNNDAIIGFLRKHGYTVLNLIEIRKPYKGEILSTSIQVENHSFDY